MDAEKSFEMEYRAIKRSANIASIQKYKELEYEELEVRLCELQRRWENANKLSELVMGTTDKDPMELEDDIADTERRYVRACVAMKKRMAELKTEKSVQPISVQVQMPVQQESVKNTWGEFKGDILKWESFRDRFVSAVHNNKNISPAFKFAYLRKSLTGEAANTLGEWQLTDENYAEAWARLNEVYGKKYPICRELLKRFFALPYLRMADAGTLQHMANTKYETVRQLKGQGVPVEHWDMVIVHTLHERLDAETARNWELNRSCDMPSWEELAKFLEKQAGAMPMQKPAVTMSKGAVPKKTVERMSVSSGEYMCEACTGNHPLYKCSEFLSLGIVARKNYVSSRRLCPNCLKKGHDVTTCYKGACNRCPGIKHNSVLCEQSMRRVNAVTSMSKNEQNVYVEQESMFNQKANTNKFKLAYTECFIKGSDFILLPTAAVMIEVNLVRYGPVRALIDTGAQLSMMSTSFQERNGLVPFVSNKSIVGIGGDSVQVKSYVRARIRARFNSEAYVEEIFWVLPKSSDLKMILPSERLDPIPFNSQIGQLADPEYWRPGPIELVIGAGACARAISAVLHRDISGLVVLESTFGALIFGSNEQIEQRAICSSVTPIELVTNKDLDILLQRMWQSEQMNEHSRTRSEEEQMVEDNFLSTYYRDRTGRFVVTIPLKNNVNNFGSSRATALKRFFILEKKLQRDAELREKYCTFMREYEELGHMQRVTRTVQDGQMVYYIPHHCVTKKFRVVFDASCPTDTGVALNHIQLLGEKLQKDLFQIIMRFRRHKVAISADVRMMFRQVCIAPEQWDLQRIFWRERASEPLREYWLTVVTYGMTSSAHNAVRALVQCARDAAQYHPEAADVIEQDFYMDDCVSGADSVEEATKLAQEVSQVLKDGGVELRKWKSNSNELVREMSPEHEESMLFTDDVSSSVLGLKWLIKSDQFTYEVKRADLTGPVTKRSIISRVAQLYDPNGYITPVTIKGKMIIQEIWKLSLDWDDEVTPEIREQWRAYWQSMNHLEHFKISRWVGVRRAAVVQVHGFSDASNKAYGAVIYVRVQCNEQVQTNLLVSKARVVPLKCMTIPRLELAAARLLVQLLRVVLAEMGWEDCDYTLWCDSQVVLHWIRKNPRDLKVFVANRVAEVQRYTKIERWRYVNTKDNPADLLSRGMFSEELVGNQLWLHGPKWLSKTEQEWPKNIFELTNNNELQKELRINLVVESKKNIQIYLPALRKSLQLLNYVSKLERAVNILSFVLRFISRTKQRSKRRRLNHRSKTIFPPTSEEKTRAIEILLGQEQNEHFGKEIRALQNDGRVQTGSMIESLKPILDAKGLVRVGGRIDRADEPYEMKHPTIIKNNTRLAWLIFEQAHRATRHGGVQVMMHFIRQKFWVPRLRNELRNFIHKCVVCARYNSKFEQQLMSELPSDRLQVGKAFLHTGVDYAGPFMVKIGERARGPTITKKCWIAIFVCLKTRAVHIDIVTDLTSLAFIACYERFICRRGRCERIYSDNGTAFVGASKELRRAVEKWQTQDVFAHLSMKGTEWRFMIPAAPHQGGIYEAAEKSMKYHLKRVVGQKTMKYEQFQTLLCEIEAILNSRPLTPLSDDCNDVQALTPGHFLVGEPLVVPLPFITEQMSDTSSIKMWRERQTMVRHFWARWSEEYLATLQERKKWRREKESVKLGQIVLLKSEVFPPAQWALGRICELIKSKDGLIRSVAVKTATNRLLRPVQKLCILPVEGTEQETRA